MPGQQRKDYAVWLDHLNIRDGTNFPVGLLPSRMAMSEGMAKCDPVLLEPICLVQIAVPTEFTSRVHGLISGRRGQILGYDAKAGWTGWDEVNAYLPQSDLHDLIIELRTCELAIPKLEAGAVLRQPGDDRCP